MSKMHDILLGEYSGLLKNGLVSHDASGRVHLLEAISSAAKKALVREKTLSSRNSTIDELFGGGLVPNKLCIYESSDLGLMERVASSFIASSLVAHPSDRVIYMSSKSFYPKLVISRLPADCDHRDSLSRLLVMPVYIVKDLIIALQHIKSLENISLIVINELGHLLQGVERGIYIIHRNYI